MLKTQGELQPGYCKKQQIFREERKSFSKAVLQFLTCPINNQTPGEINLCLKIFSVDNFLLSLHEL